MTRSTRNGIRGRGGKRGAWEGFAKSCCLGILVCVSRIERIAHAGKDMGQRAGQTTCEAHFLSVQALKGNGQEDSYKPLPCESGFPPIPSLCLLCLVFVVLAFFVGFFAGGARMQTWRGRLRRELPLDIQIAVRFKVTCPLEHKLQAYLASLAEREI